MTHVSSNSLILIELGRIKPRFVNTVSLFCIFCASNRKLFFGSHVKRRLRIWFLVSGNSSFHFRKQKGSGICVFRWCNRNGMHNFCDAICIYSFMFICRLAYAIWMHMFMHVSVWKVPLVEICQECAVWVLILMVFSTGLFYVNGGST